MRAMNNKGCALFRTGHIWGGDIFSLFTAAYCSFIMAELIATFCHSFHYLLWPFVCFSLLLYFFLSRCGLDQWRSHSDSWNHLLVVTAHPDDECMFFAPTLLHFRRRKKNISVLCLSTGKQKTCCFYSFIWGIVDFTALSKFRILLNYLLYFYLTCLIFRVPPFNFFLFK